MSKQWLEELNNLFRPMDYKVKEYNNESIALLLPRGTEGTGLELAFNEDEVSIIGTGNQVIRILDTYDMNGKRISREEISNQTKFKLKNDSEEYNISRTSEGQLRIEKYSIRGNTHPQIASLLKSGIKIEFTDKILFITDNNISLTNKTDSSKDISLNFFNMDRVKAQEILKYLKRVNTKLVRYYLGLYPELKRTVTIIQAQAAFSILGIDLTIENGNVLFFENKRLLCFNIDSLDGESTVISLDEFYNSLDSLRLFTANRILTLELGNYDDDLTCWWYLTDARIAATNISCASLPLGVNNIFGYGEVHLSTSKNTVNRSIVVQKDGSTYYWDETMSNQESGEKIYKLVDDVTKLRGFFSSISKSIVEYYCLLYPWFEKVYSQATIKNQANIDTINEGTLSILKALGFEESDLAMGFTETKSKTLEDKRVISATPRSYPLYDNHLYYFVKKKGSNITSIKLEWFRTEKPKEKTKSPINGFYPIIHIYKKEKGIPPFHMRISSPGFVSFIIEKKVEILLGENKKKTVTKIIQDTVGRDFRQTPETLTGVEMIALIERAISDSDIILLLDFFSQLLGTDFEKILQDIINILFDQETIVWEPCQEDEEVILRLNKNSGEEQ